MARETKAQRLEREAAERAAYEAEMAATYPQRLMAMLERATKVNFELDVYDSKFRVTDRDDRDEWVELSLEYSQANQEALHKLDWQVEMKEAHEREAERKYQLRRAALAKLTKEERQELGL